MREILDNNFAEEVENYNGVVAIDFWASWCGPCKMIAPIFQELSNELGEKVKFVKVNVDENQGTAGRFSVMSIPTLILFKDGNPLGQIVGFQPKEALVEILNQYI